MRFVHALVEGAPSVSAAAKSATTGVAMGGNGVSPIAGQESGATIWTIDADVRSTISAMLKDLADLWPKPVDPALAEKKSNTDKKNKERGKAAQQRMLEMMRRK